MMNFSTLTFFLKQLLLFLDKNFYGNTNFGVINTLNPLPDDDNFEFDENTRKFSKRAENTVGKEEIAHYEQFLLFPQCFQKACFPGASKGVIVLELVKMCPLCGRIKSHLLTALVFTCFEF